MLEWAENFIIALGGSAVVLIGIFAIFKELFIKFFESRIESSFEKSLEKFKNRLERSTRAYEILLDREILFYEKTGSIAAELIPLEHDLLYYLRHDREIERENKCESFQEQFKRYSELIKTIKNETLIHQIYIPQTIFTAFTEVVKQMQDDIHYWIDMAKLLFAGEYNKIDYHKGEEVVDILLKRLAAAEVEVKKRLEQLCNTSECIK